jgi:hypothetical protein
VRELFCLCSDAGFIPLNQTLGPSGSRPRCQPERAGQRLLTIPISRAIRRPTGRKRGGPTRRAEGWIISSLQRQPGTPTGSPRRAHGLYRHRIQLISRGKVSCRSIDPSKTRFRYSDLSLRSIARPERSHCYGCDPANRIVLRRSVGGALSLVGCRGAVALVASAGRPRLKLSSALGPPSRSRFTLL